MKKSFTAALAAIVSGIFCLMSFAADTDKNLKPVEVETAFETAVEYDGENDAVSAKQDDENASLYSLLLGNGTQESPYEIYNSFDLFYFADSINMGEDTTACYKLMNDIDLEGEVWTPVGMRTDTLEFATCFSGVFDGNGHTISNFSVAGNTQYVGFFGYIYNGTVKNLTVSDFEIDVSSANPLLYAGGLVGRCLSAGEGKSVTIENCVVKNGSVKASGDGSVYAGGLAGYIMSSEFSGKITVKNSASYVNVEAESVSDEKASASVEAYAGGLVGYLAATEDTSLSLSLCHATGDVRAVTTPNSSYQIGAFAGGLTGFVGVSGGTSSLEISKCYSLGSVYSECTLAGYSGGFSGYFSSVSGTISVFDCYSSSNASAMTHSVVSENNYVCVGSFASAATPGVHIENCFVSGNAEDMGSPDSYAGVLFGYNFGASSKNCYYPDTVVVDGALENKQDAKAVTAENINNPDSYEGFDFENTWKFFEAGYKYPVFNENAHLFRVDVMSAGKIYETYVFEYGEAFVLPEKAPADYSDFGYDYTFSHWSGSENGETVIEQNVPVIDNITVYAVFTSRAKLFEVVFVNQGNVFQTESIAYGSHIPQPEDIPTKEADINFWYKFVRWSRSEDGSDKTPLSDITVSGNLTLYAVFEGFDHSVWDGKNNRKIASGNGTQANPYKISDGYELAYMRMQINNDIGEYAGAYYELTADINLGGNEWSPIGTPTNPFTGSFDGNGYKIHSFEMKLANAYAGLFGITQNADIGRFSLSDIDIDISRQGEITAGFVAATSSMDGSFHEISVTDSSMKLYSEQFSVESGGIVGSMTSSDGENIVSDCSVSADIHAHSDGTEVYAGYIAGYVHSKDDGFSGIANCYALGSLSAQGKYTYAGGIAGYIESAGLGMKDLAGSNAISDELSDKDDAVIYGCFAVGSVKASAETFAYAGQIAGAASEYAKTADCYYYEEMSIEAYAQDGSALLNQTGIPSATDNFRRADFLIDKLGFDFVTAWMLPSDNAYMYPVLKILTLEKPVFTVKNVYNVASSVSLDVRVMAIDSEAYSVVLSVYSDRGRLIGIKTLKIEDNTLPTAHEFRMVIDPVRDADYIKLTVIDNQSRQLLFPTVYKSVA